MEKVTVQLGERGYDILIGSATLPTLGAHCRTLGPGTAATIVTNQTVAAHYLTTVQSSLAKADFDVSVCELEDGERFKTIRSISHIHDHLVARRMDRNGLLVALGGGVIGDMAGFAAATFLRGIGFVQVPTTVVAQVDSSVGGKTGVNHPRGKNLIGAFHQPRLVFMDMNTLATLPRRELLAGIAEVIKYGVISDPVFFDYLEANVEEILALEPGVTAHVVRRCCELKAAVVADDERETSGRRAILNYGHTVGHALEAVTRYRRYLHGEAVGIGMVAAARIAHREGILDEDQMERQRTLLQRFGLPTEIPARIDRAAVADAMTLDKKAAGGHIRMVLAERIGQVKLVAFSAEKVRELVRGT
ncbi:MAG: 3-dehydroquinate synthase [Nitrospirota bacterium]|nr:3-dehydroquinate synthase [Nitrospirota bacterium]